MTPRFVGLLNFAPQDHADPDMWQLEWPYGQVTSDGYLIICPPWRRLDGASIPRWAWPLVGHPFDEGNRFWSVAHDAGYNGYAIVIDLAYRGGSSEEWLRMHASIAPGLPIPPKHFPRRWWDGKMVEAMRLCGENAPKRAAVWSAVRVGGWVAYR